MHMVGKRISGWLALAIAASAVLVVGIIVMSGVFLPRLNTGAPNKTSAAQACVSKFSVSPASGSAGTHFTAQGNSWPAGKSLGVYLVDPTHHLRPTALQLLTVPQNGAWQANITIPQAVTFHAVGDETTGSGAPQTISQTVAPGQYLIYAAAGDASTFSAASVCPVKFTIAAASAGALTHTSLPTSHNGLAAPLTNTSAGQAPATSMPASTANSVWTSVNSASLLVMLLLLICALALMRRAWLQMVVRRYHRQVFAAASASLAFFMLLALAPSGTGASSVVRAAAAASTSTTLYSDDFEADTIGSFPAGWSVEAGSAWSVQANGTQALEQTSTSTSTLYGVYAGSSTWTDYSLAADVQPGAGSATANTSIVAIEGRYQNANNFYSLLVKNGNQWYLGKKVNGTWTTLAYGSTSYTTTGWYSWTLTMTGTTISASINGATLATATDSTFSAGEIGLKTRNVSSFDNVVVTATGSTSPTPTPTTGATATPGPTATATATATPAATATATPFGNGSITGQITDAATGAPIAGAQVSTVPASLTATTDSLGHYTLANVSGATYDVVVTASGYNTNHASNVYISNGSSVTVNIAQQAIPAYTAMDNFTRPDQSGWNPATDGNTWTDDAAVYPGAFVSIQGNLGYVDTYTAATDRDEWMSPYYADQLVSGDFNVSQYGQDSYQHGARLLGRIQDGNNFIDFAINYATSTLQIWSNKNNTWVMLTQVSTPAFKTGQWYHSKLLTVGTMSYGKVWAYNTAEPAWQISGSQTVLTTGSGGARSTYCDINWANFKVQAVTSITGVVKNTSGSAIAGATVSDGQNSVTTDASGRYVLIEPNTSTAYTITASATGYTTQSAAATTKSLTSTTLNFTL